MKSFRRHGRRVASDARSRFCSEPWKNCWSVRTDSAAAPPSSSSAASLATSKSARINPFDGDAFFNSAITTVPDFTARPRLARNPRGWCRSAAAVSARRSAESRVAATRSRVATMMFSSLLGIVVNRIYPKHLRLTYRAGAHTVRANPGFSGELTCCPTGIVMIALYHFLSAAFLLILASALAVGGGILAAMFGAGSKSPLSAMGLGLFVGVLGAAFTMVFAVVAAIAGYGVWTLREWGRILCIGLAGLSILLSLPGSLFIGLHFWFFGG